MEQSFIHILEDRTHCTLSILTDDTKLERMTNALGVCTACQMTWTGWKMA